MTRPLTRTPTQPHIAYSVAGDHGPHILLVMGFGMRGAIWRPQVEGLRRDHQVVTYDHLGVGDSDPPVTLTAHGRLSSMRAIARAVTMASMARDALRVLDAVGWADAHVVGVSMGGMIAQEIALRFPSRVRSLTLVATHPGGVSTAFPSREGLRRFAAANLTKEPADRVAALKRLLYPDEFLERVDVAALDQRITEMAGRRAPGRTIAGHLGAVLRHQTRTRLHRIQAPTMIVRPGQDILIDPHNSDVLARAIPNAKVVRFDDAGHGVTFQCATELNREIARHVASADAARRTSAIPATPS
ncbi:MAG: alpha/beta fold hydrolase [Polyangiales bacterium]